MVNVTPYSVNCLSFAVTTQSLSKGAKSSVTGCFEEFFEMAALSVASATGDTI
jgi:hypothetical protein